MGYSIIFRYTYWNSSEYYIANITRPFTIFQRSDVLILENIALSNLLMDPHIVEDQDTLLLDQ